MSVEKLLIDENIAAQVFKEPENHDHMNIRIKSDEWTNIYTRKVSICTAEWETTSDEIRRILKLENIIQSKHTRFMKFKIKN